MKIIDFTQVDEVEDLATGLKDYFGFKKVVVEERQMMSGQVLIQVEITPTFFQMLRLRLSKMYGYRLTTTALMLAKSSHIANNEIFKFKFVYVCY